MENNILVALSKSITSRQTIDFLINLKLRIEDVKVTLLHILRKPNAQEELMGKKFGAEQVEIMKELLDDTKARLVGAGFMEVETLLITGEYQTVTDALIEHFEKNNYSMLVIGRKHMSRSEEFILGDISVKLIRHLKGAAIMVVKSK